MAAIIAFADWPKSTREPAAAGTLMGEVVIFSGVRFERIQDETIAASFEDSRANLANRPQRLVSRHNHATAEELE